MEAGSDSPARRTLRGIRLALWAASLTGVLASHTALAVQEPVDLELILAVDASSSVSAEEFDLQIKGLAEAFRSPEVLAAIQAGGDFGIAVSLMQWSDNRKQILAVDWSAVRDETSTLALADQIEATPRYLVGGGTAIGGAIHFAVRQFDSNGFEGRRRVIDISGDGRTNQGSQPSEERDMAVALGIDHVDHRRQRGGLA